MLHLKIFQLQRTNLHVQSEFLSLSPEKYRKIPAYKGLKFYLWIMSRLGGENGFEKGFGHRPI